jgi:hypothetical protein
MFEYLTESKAFRNENMIDKFSSKDMSEILFGMMLGVELIYKLLPEDCVSYKLDTLKYPMFDRIYLSTTDLGNAISMVKNAKTILDAKYSIDIPILDIKHYLRSNLSDSDKRALFIKLQSRLRIHNTKLINIRREILDSYSLNNILLKNKTSELMNILRTYDYKMDILSILQKYIEK